MKAGRRKSKTIQQRKFAKGSDALSFQRIRPPWPSTTRAPGFHWNVRHKRPPKDFRRRALLFHDDPTRHRRQKQLESETRRDGGTGRRSGLKIRRGQPRGGSTPPPGTKGRRKSESTISLDPETPYLPFRGICRAIAPPQRAPTVYSFASHSGIFPNRASHSDERTQRRPSYLQPNLAWSATDRRAREWTPGDLKKIAVSILVRLGRIVWWT